MSRPPSRKDPHLWGDPGPVARTYSNGLERVPVRFAPCERTGCTIERIVVAAPGRALLGYIDRSVGEHVALRAAGPCAGHDARSGARRVQHKAAR